MPYSAIIHSSKILIIDDDSFTRTLLRKIFESNGFNNITEASNGEEGWAETLRIMPDLVILDINMPIMDGYEYCKRARAHELFEKMVILIQSIYSEADEKQKIFASGATDYVSKPFDPHEILARSLVHLKNTHYIRQLENFNNRVKTELQSAKRLVDISLPPELLLQNIKNNHGVDIFSYFQSSSEMGGDFWGTHEIDKNRIGIYVVDFSGHGVDAALNATRLDCLIKSSFDKSSDPAKLLEWLNNNLYALLPPEQYATMFYGVIDTKTSTITYAAAASPEMYIFINGGEVHKLSGEGFPLGAVKESTYNNETAPFMVGDILMLYSDALIETQNANGEYLVNIAESYLSSNKKTNISVSNARECFDLFIYNFMNDYGSNITDDLTVTVYHRLC